jgi:hypothetical protein
MKTLVTILFITLGIFYIVTPYNLLPNFIPVIGWIDNIAVAALIIFYLKNGRLPDFINRFLGRPVSSSRQAGGGSRNGGYDPGYRQYRGEQAGSTSRRRSRVKNPYEILGIDPGASSEEIHSAYRRLVQQYHPDKVSHLGKEIQETAERKFVEIQAAYEQLNGKRQ